MNKLFALSMFVAVPASASVVVMSPVTIQVQSGQSSLKQGGNARCINPNGCRSAFAPYSQTVAGYNEVYQGVISDGVDANGVPFIVVYTQGSANLPFTGIYTRADDWVAA